MKNNIWPPTLFGRARSIIFRLFTLGFATLATGFMPTSSFAQSEIPVLVKPPSAAKIMLLIDDSGSMEAVLEHPEFSATNTCSVNTSNTIPSVIFKLLSGTSAPAATQQLAPMLIEVNAGFYSATNSTTIYASKALNSASSLALVGGMTCNNTQGSQTCCPGTSGGSCPQSGINTGALYGNSSITGANVFQMANLATYGGSTITDTSGNEYLYLQYRGNAYENGSDDWSGVWGKFDSSGNILTNYTTAYSITGGTVKFNNREVFLSQGWYRREYLRWIFYCATSSQLSTLPGSTRIDAVKNVVTSLVNSNPSVNFGIATLNGTTYSPGTYTTNLYDQWYGPQGNVAACGTSRIRQIIGTTAATIISDLSTISASGGTPLTNTYIEALRYFGGAARSDSCTSSTTAYTSPMTGQCDAHAIIVMTDGLPSTESAKKWPNGSYPTNVDSNSNPAASMSSCSSGNDACFSSFFSDSAWWGYHTDLRSTVSGIQNVVTYAIAFGVDRYPTLDRVAAAGGSGTVYTAVTSSDLSSALQSIVGIVFETPTSGAGVATLEKLYGEAKVYQPIFYADQWVGRIQVLHYDSSSETLLFDYDIADTLDSRDISASPRRIITGNDPDNDGKTNTTLNFTSTNASALRPLLFRFYDNATLSSSLLPTPLQSYTQTGAASTLISYISGQAISGMRVRDRNADNKVDRLGDIVYAKPVEVGPKNGNYNLLDDYNDYVASRNSQPHLLLVGANDGMLHAFNSITGEELWAYIPSSQLPYLERLGRLAYTTQYRRAFVDGPISVEDVYRNGAWHTIAMFGLRSGGSSYTVLDITERSNPTLIWEVSDPAIYGQSWAKPVVVISNAANGDTNPASYKWYMTVGTGEGKTTTGVNLAVYDLSSTTPPTPTTIVLSSSDAAGTRSTGVATSDDDQDRNVDRLYVGTETGDLYRVAVNGLASAWTAARVYDGPVTQPIVATPLTVLADNPQYTGSGSGVTGIPLAVGVYFGTGRHDQTTDITTIAANTQAIIGIFDPVDTTSDTLGSVLSALTPTNLQTQTPASFSVRRDTTSGKYLLPTGKPGFLLQLATTVNFSSPHFIDPVGEVVNPAINVRGEVLFTTFVPDTAACDIGGLSFLTGVHFATGGGAVVDRVSTPRRPFYNGGVPDVDGNGQFNSTDLTQGVSSGRLEPVFDAAVSTVDLSNDVTPYQHDGALTVDDVRLQSSNTGAILPSVCAVGHTGLPGSPSLLLGTRKIVVPEAYPSDPGPAGSGSGNGGTGENGQIGSTDQMPPPKLVPMNMYNLPVRMLSFHEVTGD